MRGYPVGTVAFYGATDSIATKVAVGVIEYEGGHADILRPWFSEAGDIRNEVDVLNEVVEFLKEHKIRSVAMMDGIIGCPHEEGIDYPEGEVCPECPFWANRDRWTGDVIQ
jgi:hypothetical protein